MDIENNAPVHIINVESSVTCLSWVSCILDSSDDVADKEVKSSNGIGAGCSDDIWSFLTKFPLLSKAYSYTPSSVEDVEDCQKLDPGGSVTLLICGTNEGRASLYMNGFLHCARIDIKNSLIGHCNISG